MSCVSREIVLPVPRERAWELVTEEDELREWLADDVEFEAEEGAPIHADDRDGVIELVGPRSGSSSRGAARASSGGSTTIPAARASR
jgi:hypothetical protein